MFAVLVPGRMVQTAVQSPSSPERFVTVIPDVEKLNHLTVFLTGTVMFPEGFAASIHLETPGKGWQMIGGLSNEKPSAIFRIKNMSIPSQQFNSFSSSSPGDVNGTSATLGILCEPIPSIAAQLAALDAATGGQRVEVTMDGSAPSSTALVLARNPNAQGAVDPVVLAQKIAVNLFNHVAGFAQPLPDGSGSWIALNVIEKWFNNVTSKLKNAGVGFLLNE